MPPLADLQAELADLDAQLSALDAQAAPEGLTETQAEEHTQLTAQFDATHAAIGREQAATERKRRLIPQGTAITPDPDPESANRARELDQDFANQPEGTGGFEGANPFGQMLVAVASYESHGGPPDPRLIQAAVSGAGSSVPSEGGFLVATDTSSELLRMTYENTQLMGGVGYSGIQIIPIGANADGLKVNAIDETSRVNGSRWGGVQAYWEGEAEAPTATKPKFRQVSMELKDLKGLMYATDKLLKDASALEAIVQTAFSEEFAFKIQDGVVNGTGAGMPLGILASGAAVPVTKETGQDPATIVKENIDKMWAKMPARSMPNAVWLINQNCYPQLFSLNQVIGTGGVPVYLPPGGLSVAPFGTLLGRPVVPIEQCASVGTVGDIIFADLSEYAWIDKGGVANASSIHVRFIYNETTFRFIYRADGQPKLNAPITPYKGGATHKVSPFVTLATRAT